MRVLGIETSCDETSVAVVEGDLLSSVPLKVLSSVLASSAEMQIKYGGILPERAAREQILAMLPTLSEALQKACLNLEGIGHGIDAIAVTNGPGLVGSLLVGLETARTLSFVWRKPIVPVNHLVAHLYANFLASDKVTKIPEFPAIGLVVSGGHTDMVFMTNFDKIILVGSTRDDAAGECFDKTARMLGLPYPGGPEISQLATRYFEKKPVGKLKFFPRPLSNQETFDWSFSGLKTSVLYKIKSMSEKEVLDNRELLAAEIQEAICDSLVEKLKKAIWEYKPKSVLVAGGVAANKRLTEKIDDLKTDEEWKLFIPQPGLCTDNGSYIAAYAFYHFSPIPWHKIEVNPGMRIV